MPLNNRIKFISFAYQWYETLLQARHFMLYFCSFLKSYNLSALPLSILSRETRKHSECYPSFFLSWHWWKTRISKWDCLDKSECRHILKKEIICFLIYKPHQICSKNCYCNVSKAMYIKIDCLLKEILLFTIGLMIL